MTAPAAHDPGYAHPSTSARRMRRTAGRGLLVATVAASLVAASLLRGYVMSSPTFRAKESNAFVATNATSDQFDSYTLGLLLGGLRGPLVMTLWSSSENQKSNRDLEDINTKIELIRLLQPEFDSVHLFQIWNKAYNLSVQMANLPSKYATILDAIDYANRTRSGKENINIESAVAGIYFDKLGGANEKAYYRARVREESQQPQAQVKITFPATRRDEFVRTALAAGADARRYTIRPESGSGDQLSARLRADYAEQILKSFTGADVQHERFEPHAAGPSQTTLRSRLEPVLDADGNLLPNLAKPRPETLSDLVWDPSYGDLQYLTRFQPFKRGVSPFAFAYNYYKRATALQASKNQSHAQLSDRVISSRMTLALKNWAEEEIELGRYAELAHFGKQPLSEEQSPLPLETPSADVPIDAQAITPLLSEAIAAYDRAASVAQSGVVELRGHIERYTDDFATYGNLKADLVIKGSIAAGDAEYLRLVTSTDPAERAQHAKAAADAYSRAIELIQRIILAYYVPDVVIQASFPQEPGKVYGKIDVINSFDDPRTFPSELIRPTLSKSLRLMQEFNEPVGSEVGEYQTYLQRLDARLNRLGPLVGQSFRSSANLLDPGPTAPQSSTGPALPGVVGPMLPATAPATPPSTPGSLLATPPVAASQPAIAR